MKYPVNIESLYQRKDLNYIQILKNRYKRRISDSDSTFLAVTVPSLILVPAIFGFLAVDLHSLVGTLNVVFSAIITYFMVVCFLFLTITLFPDRLSKTDKNIFKLNHIVVNEDLTVSRAYNFIDMEQSDHINLMIHLPKGTKLMEDFIETEIVKHGLKKEDEDLIKHDLIQNCKFEEYSYLELKSIIDAKFSIIEYEEEKIYLLNKLEQNERVKDFRQNLFDKNQKMEHVEPSLITELRKEKKRIEDDELEELEHLNRLINNNKNIVSKYIEKN